MNTRSRSILTLAAVAMATIALTANSADAASIGVNVGPNGGTGRLSTANNVLPSTTSAGVIPQTNWNDLTGGSQPATALVDDSGNLLTTTATVSTQWVNGVQDHGSADGDQIMMNGGLDGGDNTTLSSVVANNIPYAVYDVYWYFDGGNSSGLSGDYTITPGGIGPSAPQTKLGTDNGTFSGTYIEDTGSGGNYLYFPGVTGTELTLSSIPTDSPSVDRAPWNGFQIVDAAAPPAVPEPSTAVLAVLGMLGLIGFRRRRRR